MSDPERIDAVALSLAAGQQPARSAGALRTAAAAWPFLPLEASLAVLGRHGPGAVAHWRAEAGRVLARADALGHRPVWPAHEAYPALLRAIPDPPLVLWVRGQIEALQGPAVALVGSRDATAGGRDVAHALGADLAAAGVVVASGFARGIDASAHLGAVSTGRSLAVLGCGLDQAYPSDHGPLGDAIAARGALVSEFPPGTPPLAHHFPLRNRTLSGVCRAVVVVQARERSGSLITARLALEQGRDVMAVPGDVRTGANAGGHALIRDGARLVERAADVLDELGWVAAPTGLPLRSAAADDESGTLPGDGLAGQSRSALLGLLVADDGLALDDLMASTGRNSSELLGELLDLELAGLVCRDPSGRFLTVQRKW